MSSLTTSQNMKACSIERFKSINYLTWNMKVEMFFKRNDISSMVDGLNPNPRNIDLVAPHARTLHDDKTRSIFSHIVEMFNFIWFKLRKP